MMACEQCAVRNPYTQLHQLDVIYDREREYTRSSIFVIAIYLYSLECPATHMNIRSILLSKSLSMEFHLIFPRLQIEQFAMHMPWIMHIAQAHRTRAASPTNHLFPKYRLMRLIYDFEFIIEKIRSRFSFSLIFMISDWFRFNVKYCREKLLGQNWSEEGKNADLCAIHHNNTRTNSFNRWREKSPLMRFQIHAIDCRPRFMK